MRNLAIGLMAVVALVVFAGPAQADLVDPGVGPYRLAFITSTDPGCTLSTIEEYNAYIQDLANAAGLGDATWKVLGSTSLVDARDNTGTNPAVDGVGVPVYLVDGTTLVADNNADLWDGEVAHIIDQDEYGTAKSHWPFTGTYWDGTLCTGKPNANGGGLDNLTGEVGQGQSGVTTNWIWRQYTSDPAATELPLYGMSDIIPEPATMGLLALGGVALLARRRRRS